MKHFIQSFCILGLIIGCGTREEYRSEAAGDVALAPEVNTRAGSPQFAQLAFESPSPLPESRLPSRMVIKTATLNLEVSIYTEAFTQIQKVATQYGGYLISASTQTHDNDIQSGNLTIRVEAKNFDAALQDLKKVARKVEQESVQGNDVTEEFYDLTARLENKRKAEKRYQEILASAKTTKDILEVEQALTTVREEIERLEGRKRFLDDQVSLSTINVSLHEPYPLVASGQYGFLAKMRRGVEEGLSGFSEVLSACITFVIAGIPLFVILFLVIFLFKKYRRRTKAAQLAKATMAEKKE